MPRPRPLLLLLPLTLAPCLALSACMVPTGRTPEDILRDKQTRVVKSGWDQYDDQRSDLVNEVHDARAGKERGRVRRDFNAPHGWCLSLAVLTGADRLARARQLALKHEIKNPLFAERDGSLEILVNRYEKPDDGAITDDLRQWQRSKKPGEERSPFETAALRALPTGRRPSGEPLDASQFSGQASLLVAFYTEDFGKHWREEAKRVARLLRKDGPDGQGGVEALWRINEDKKEAAILVGLFTRKDDWVRKPTRDQRNGHVFFTDAPGPLIDAMAQRFPFLLKNGKKIPLGGDSATGAGPEECAKASLSEL